MSNTSEVSNPGRKRKSWLFKLGIVAAGLFVLVVAAYFVATSGAFIKGVILPKAGAAMNADISASDISLSPWSELVVSDLKLTPKGQPTLFEAKEIRAKYSLWDILHGKIVVSEAGVTAPVITYVKNADGTSNVDPLTQKTATQPAATPASAKAAGAPLQIDIKNVYLKNARVEAVINQSGGAKTVARISDFNFNIDQLQNGQSSKITLGSGIAVEMSGGTNTPGTLSAKLSGAFDVKLSPALQPDGVSGNLKFETTAATGSLAALQAVATALDLDLSQTDIRKLSLRLEQSGATLAEVRVSGPFSTTTLEGKLKVELASVDRRALNIAGAAAKIDFNKTAISSVNEIEIKQKAKVIVLNGKFLVNDFSATLPQGTTPTLNIQSAYAVNVDLDKSSAVLQQFDVAGTANQAQFLKIGLSKPMPIAWGAGAGLPDEAALDIVITNFNIANWAALAGDLHPQGILNATEHIVSKQAGNQIASDLAVSLSGLGAQAGSNKISGLDIQFSLGAQVDKFKAVSLDRYQLTLSHNGAAALSASGSGKFNLETQDAEIQASLQGQIPALLQAVQVPGIAFKSGEIRFDGRVAKNKDDQTVAGTLALANLSGALPNATLDRLGAKFEADIAVKGDAATINKFAGTLEQSGAAAGALDVKGAINLKTKAGKFDLAVTDINQNLLKPFAEPVLSGKQLSSISVNLNTTATLDTKGGINAQGALSVTNLVVRDTQVKTAPKPQSVTLKFDAGMETNRVDVRQILIALAPTDRASNQINIKGQADLAKTSAINANFSIDSDGIDFTALYDQLTGGTNAPAATNKPAATAAAPRTEPAALQLPVGLATVNLNISRLYLRQIEITNWQAAIRVETNRVTVNPFQLKLNGAPVTLAVNAFLGVPGYTYDVNFTADKLPIEKIADSFVSPAGSYKGLALASVAIKGAGITDASIRSNINGQINLTLTNASIQITNFSTNQFFTAILPPIATALNAPEILSDPLNTVLASVALGQQKAVLQTLRLQSKSFAAGAHGDITLADPLTSSALALPIDFGLGQSIAQRIPYFSAIAATNSGYAMVPNFISVSGTVAKPQAKFSMLDNIADTAKQAVKSAATQAYQSAKDSLLNGGTNGVSGKSLLNNLKDSALGSLKNSGGQTNATGAAATNAPASTNADTSPASLINQGLNLFKKK